MSRGTIDFDDERTPKPVKKAVSIDMNTGRSASIDVEPEENVQNEPKKTSFSRPQFKKPAYQRCEFKTVDFIFLRRGVMSVNKIGYV